jgi:hypothetical protein
MAFISKEHNCTVVLLSSVEITLSVAEKYLLYIFAYAFFSSFVSPILYLVALLNISGFI